MRSQDGKLKHILQKYWVSWLLICGLTVLIYSGTLSYGMLANFDDDAYFGDTRIQDLKAANTGAYFTDYYLGMYQPIPVLSFALVNHISPDSMWSQRVLNLLLHCLNILLVLLITRKLTGNIYIGALTALFFAIHPMHVESVTWLSTRSNLLYSAFYLGAVLTYINRKDEHKLLNWCIVILFFTLSLLSKVTAATLPAVLLLTGWYQGRKFKLSMLLPNALLFILSGIFIWIGVQASAAFGHITDMGQSYTFTERVILVLHAQGLYLAKFLFPLNLSAIYLFPFKESGSLPVSYLISAVLALAAIAVMLWAGWKWRRMDEGKAVLFGVLFYLITISIVMPLKWSRTVIIAERYTYLPYIGLTAALLVVLFSVWKKYGKTGKVLLVAMLVLTAVLFSLQSSRRNKAWENPATLFTDVIENKQGKAEVSMGYYNRGNEYLRLKNAGAAISDYSSAIEIYPTYREAFYNRGLVYYLSGNNDAAIADFTRAIALKDDFVDAFINRAAAYRNTGMYELALNDLDWAISIHPSALAYLSRGVLFYSNFNNPEKACQDWNVSAQMGSDQAKQLLQQYCRVQ